jgi:type IV pilus assembly protein PilV
MDKKTQDIQSGFSMIELVVATAIFSMGLGSLSIMLLASVHGTAEARHRTVATTQANSLAEMIALQSDAFDHHINPPGADMPACSEDFCTGDSPATSDLQSWQSQLALELPGASGLVCRDGTPDDGSATDSSCDGSGALVVKVFWSEARHEQAEDKGRRRVVSRLPW